MRENDLLKIREFSKLTGIKTSTLRYYDELGLFSPAVRGANEYRYYEPHQIITINSIHLLHELDMTIRQISEVEKNRSPQSVMEVLGAKESELKAELDRLERSYNVIHTLRTLIHDGLDIDENALSVQHRDAYALSLGPENDFTGTEDFYDAFTTFCAKAESYNIDLRFPVGGLYADLDAYLEKPSLPTKFFSLDGSGPYTREAGNYLIGYARGFYGEMAGLQERMSDYAKTHDLTPVGPVTIVYLHDEICVKDLDRYLCEVQVRVE
jgi:DNA-binding transcriptional MerR regulator/effector-binding domain-containing protein